MAVYPRLDRLQRPGLVTNPGAAWHEKEAARVRVEWRKGPPGSRKQTYFAGLRDAHDYSAEVSRRRGTNPQVAFDPFDYATAAEAKRARDALYRQLRAAGHLRVRRSVLRGQLEKYRGLGVGGRGVRDVYYVTWEDPTLPSEARVFGHRQNPCQPVSTRINPRRPGTRSRAAFCPEQVAPKGRFDRRSFRTVVSDGHRVTVGCPKGKWDPRRKRCKVGTQAQRILHPEGEGVCPLPGRKVRRRRGNPEYRVTAFGERERGRGKRRRREGYGYQVLGPYESPTRLPGTGSFYFPHLQAAKYHAARQFLDPAIHQVKLETAQGREVARYFRRRRTQNPPAGPVEIYRRVEFIGATKGPGDRHAGERFLHRFRTPARMLGLPDGSLLIQAARGR